MPESSMIKHQFWPLWFPIIICFMFRWYYPRSIFALKKFYYRSPLYSCFLYCQKKISQNDVRLFKLPKSLWNHILPCPGWIKKSLFFFFFCIKMLSIDSTGRLGLCFFYVLFLNFMFLSICEIVYDTCVVYSICVIFVFCIWHMYIDICIGTVIYNYISNNISMTSDFRCVAL